MLYATDGLCHNSEIGVYGHECGKPAEFIGTDRNGFSSGFCALCKKDGYEATSFVSWVAVEQPRYRMLYRPAGYATLPKGVSWSYAEVPADISHRFPDLPRSRHTYGVIYTNRRLTADEMDTFQMVSA